ncbi:MAG: amidohydrolase [Bacteroidales bacterium]|nr:amidohydrolase [Bacteroidales bacterium]
MKSLLLKSVFHNNEKYDVLIKGNRFEKIVKSEQKISFENVEEIDCSDFAIMPAFYNAHCHSAMTLFRGYADDKPLHEWLTKYIWPIEAKLNDRIVEVGSRLAVLEMIKSGTVFFSDMYYFREATMKVVEEMGIRATIGITIADMLTPPDLLEEHFNFLKAHTGESERVKLSVMPHAIYTNSEATFRRSVEIAKSENYVLHTHLSETEKEVQDCLNEYHCSPVELMEKYGAFDTDFVAAHCVHFTESDRKLFADAGATAVINPCSNLKLQSGIPDVIGMRKAKIPIALGTDGASSNNNLDMQEEMKMFALISNVYSGTNSISQQEILETATVCGARAFGWNDAGRIEEGFLADCILLDMKNERLCPNNSIVSNWIYGANSTAIDSVICNGKFVMRNRHVDGEEDIVKEAELCVKRLMK